MAYVWPEWFAAEQLDCGSRRTGPTGCRTCSVVYGGREDRIHMLLPIGCGSRGTGPTGSRT